MGCAQSDMQPANDGHHHHPHGRGKGRKAKAAAGSGGGGAAGGSGQVANGAAAAANTSAHPPPHNLAANPLAPHGARDDAAPSLVGKHKYIADVGAVVMEVLPKSVSGGGVLLVFAPPDPPGLVFAFRSKLNGSMFVKEVTDAQLQKEKDAAGIAHGWAPFFKSIASDLLKSKAVVTMNSGVVSLEVSVISSKEPKMAQPFRVQLEAKAASKGPRALHRYFVEPMTRMVQRRRQNTTEREKELRFARAECDQIVRDAALRRHQGTVERLLPAMVPLRESSGARAKTASALQSKVASIDRRLRRIRQAKEGKHPLDVMYDDGGARYFAHLPQADEHWPRDLKPNMVLADLIRTALPLKPNEDIVAITRPPSDPQLRRMLDQAPNKVCRTAMSVMTKLDDWDFNIFELEKATDGNALFFVTYALMYKLNLVSTFNIDDRVLRNFLSAVQAGYHPNPYHNATHAADVAQINYFIICKCGLTGVCGLTQEDILAALLAGAIHDYDHPGFNNNFHTRTNAYLSTLYNDRSILENHHVACVYEIMRNEKFNIFAPIEDDKQRDIRETIIEMVLSTDMGNHAKIFSAFRRRLTEGSDWKTKKEDVRLALSMSIKMADISNCGRPQWLYLEWAKNIANEFYNQGDHELRCGLPVSPFMDRRKDRADFPKGQQSFMNFVVVPMFEAISELFPAVEVALQHCTENKEYWQRMD